MSRHARELMHPADYLASSYYEVRIKALERLLIARGLVTQEEIAASRALLPPKATKPSLGAADVRPTLASGTPYDRPPQAPARFKIGDAARALNINPAGHTRLPRYARGKRGRIERIHGVFVFPDANAHGLGPSPQWLYLVSFPAFELWGRGADHGLDVSIDAWESYLEGDAG